MRKAIALAFILFAVIACLCACGGTGTQQETTAATATDAPSASASAASTAPHSETPAATEATEGETAVMNTALKEMIAGSVKDTGYTGAAYALQDGVSVYESGDDIHSVYRIASVSKQFTAAAILMLQEDGRLDINDTLDKYFPAYAHGAEVTVSHLLHMHSGIPDYVTIGSDGKIAANTADMLTMTSALANTAEENRREILSWIVAQDLDFTPGSVYYYCNSNYFLLGEIIEQVSGKDYESFIQERILTPLEMTSTGFADTWDGRAKIIDADPEAVWLDCKGICRGCGDMVSNAVDLSKWANEFIDNKLLSDHIISLMTEPADEYGCGLVIDENNGFVYHNGDLPPYKSALCVSKDGRFILVLLDCRQDTALPALRSEICANFEG